MIRPRQLTHCGTVEQIGVLIDPKLLGDGGARARVLAHVTPGALVQATPRGFLLRYPRSESAPCETAPGLPLTERRMAHGSVLLSVPLEDAELECLAPPPGAIVTVDAGVLVVHAPPFATVDLASWLPLDGLDVVEVRSLGKPPAPPREATAIAKTARAILVPDDVQAPPPEADEIRRALGEQAGQAVRRAGMLATIASAIHGWLTQQQKKQEQQSGSSAGSPFARALARLEQWLSRAMLRAGLATWLVRRHAEYLEKLFQMLDRGDVDAALRFAIPLAGAGGGGKTAPMLGMPAPRDRLEISPGGRRITSSINLAGDLYSELQQRYRRVFAKLEQQGRIEEAAFVLAELLHDAEEAVAFLERHGRLVQAAELAESRALSPGLVVRQWFLAGKRARALRIARRAGAYADAVRRLERSKRDAEAKALRLAWADQVAEAGDLAGAVEIAVDVDSAAELVWRWADMAIERGGPSGARMLGLRVGRGWGDREESRRLAWQLLAEEGAEARRLRRVFGEALAQKHSPAAREDVALVARGALRAVYADAAFGGDALPEIARQLGDLADDAALRADKPRWPDLGLREAPTHVFTASERGTSTGFDAVVLPQGRTVVAQGEGGVVLLGRNGKRIAHFDQPAVRLVISDHGDRAIALARRGSVARLGRIDLAGRRAQAWGETEIAAFAEDFDGSSWLVAVPARGKVDVLLVDVTLDGLSVLRRFDALGVAVRSMARDAQRAEVIADADSDEVVGFSFELPTGVLRGRAALAPPGDDELDPPAWIASADGAYLAIRGKTEGGTLAFLRGETRTVSNHCVANPGEQIVAAAVHRGTFAAAVATGTGIRVVLWRRTDLAVVATLVLESAERARLRLSPEHLVVMDDLGRVIAVDTTTGELVRELRL